MNRLFLISLFFLVGCVTNQNSVGIYNQKPKFILEVRYQKMFLPIFHNLRIVLLKLEYGILQVIKISIKTILKVD